MSKLSPAVLIAFLVGIAVGALLPRPEPPAPPPPEPYPVVEVVADTETGPDKTADGIGVLFRTRAGPRAIWQRPYRNVNGELHWHGIASDLEPAAVILSDGRFAPPPH